MTIQITTDPTQYGSGATEEEGQRIAAYIVKMAEAYIAENDLDADVRTTDSTGALNSNLSDDEQQVEDYIEENWIDWLPDALDDGAEPPMDFLATLQTWFYRGASDMTPDEIGLDAFETWLNQYATEPRDRAETDAMRHMWGNSDSVALDVYETDDGTFVQQDNEYAWLVPTDAFGAMPIVQPSRLIA